MQAYLLSFTLKEPEPVVLMLLDTADDENYQFNREIGGTALLEWLEQNASYTFSNRILRDVQTGVLT